MNPKKSRSESEFSIPHLGFFREASAFKLQRILSRHLAATLTVRTKAIYTLQNGLFRVKKKFDSMSQGLSRKGSRVEIRLRLLDFSPKMTEKCSKLVENGRFLSQRRAFSVRLRRLRWGAMVEICRETESFWSPA